MAKAILYFKREEYYWRTKEILSEKGTYKYSISPPHLIACNMDSNAVPFGAERLTYPIPEETLRSMPPHVRMIAEAVIMPADANAADSLDARVRLALRKQGPQKENPN